MAAPISKDGFKMKRTDRAWAIGFDADTKKYRPYMDKVSFLCSNGMNFWKHFTTVDKLANDKNKPLI